MTDLRERNLRERFEKETGESIRHNTWVDHNRKYEKWLESLVATQAEKLKASNNLGKEGWKKYESLLRQVKGAPVTHCVEFEGAIMLTDLGLDIKDGNKYALVELPLKEGDES